MKFISKITTTALAITAGLTVNTIANAGHTNSVLEAELNGKAEVHKGDPNGRGEAYVFGIDGDTTTLCYVLLVSKIQLEELAAHIHLGQPEENGPFVAFLAGPAGGDAADCLTEFEPGKFNSELLGDSEAGIVQQILSSPEDYYINVHNKRYPAGAIRGQLENVHD